MHRNMSIAASSSPLLVALPPVRVRVPPLGILSAHRTSRPLSHVLPDNIIHTSNIMTWLPHVVKLRSPRSLLFPLHDLNALHIWTVDLVPHLHTQSGQVIP